MHRPSPIYEFRTAQNNLSTFLQKSLEFALCGGYMHQPLAAVGGFGDLSTAEDDLAQRWRSARENIRLTTLLFAQPSMGLSKEILPLIPYLHGRSGANINFYFAGYSTEKSGPSDTPVTQGGDNEEWFFDVKRYLSFRADLAKQCKWSYSGAVEIVLLN